MKLRWVGREFRLEGRKGGKGEGRARGKGDVAEAVSSVSGNQERREGCPDKERFSLKELKGKKYRSAK